MQADAAALLAELRMGHIDVSLPVSRYAGGEQQLIEIAKALSKQAKLLILDEPTSSLTQSEVAILLRLVRDLKRRGTACVYISHKLDEIEAIADQVTVIRDGRFVGSAPMRELATGDIIRMMVGREMTALFPREAHAIGAVVFEAIGITCLDPDNSARRRVDDVSFALRQGEILGIAGLVGAGPHGAGQRPVRRLSRAAFRRDPARRPLDPGALSAGRGPSWPLHGARGPLRRTASCPALASATTSRSRCCSASVPPA